MTNHIPKIRALHRAIESNLFHRNPEPRLSYSRLTHAIDLLARIVHDCPDSDTDRIWSIGESGCCTVDSLIVAAYWHFAEWHSGQSSAGYRALSSLGDVFSPDFETITIPKFLTPQTAAILRRKYPETLKPRITS